MNTDIPAYGGTVVHGYFSHSLVGALILALLSMTVVRQVWDRKVGFVVGVLVFSHWLFDLAFHFPDMSVLPFNVGGLPLTAWGFGSTRCLCFQLKPC